MTEPEIEKWVNSYHAEIMKGKVDEPSADDVGIQQWGVMKDMNHEFTDGTKFNGDAFIFHLLVPDQFIPNGELTLRTKDGKDGDVIYFKLNIASYPKYVEYRQHELKPHYLGRLSNNQHVVEMIAPYKAADLGCIDKLKRAIANGETHLKFSIVNSGESGSVTST